MPHGGQFETHLRLLPYMPSFGETAPKRRANRRLSRLALRRRRRVGRIRCDFAAGMPCGPFPAGPAATIRAASRPVPHGKGRAPSGHVPHSGFRLRYSAVFLGMAGCAPVWLPGIAMMQRCRPQLMIWQYIPIRAPGTRSLGGMRRRKLDRATEGRIYKLSIRKEA